MSNGSKVSELESEVSTLNQTIENREGKIQDHENTISKLQAKVDEAKPWFEMKEEERKAEETKLEEQRKAEAAKKAEEQAKKQAEEEAAKKAEEEAKKQAEAQKYNTGLTYEDLARNPSGNMGKLVKFKGKILQVMNSSTYVQYRMAIDSDYDKVVLIQINKSKLSGGNILEDDIITIEGTFVKESEYTTVMGAAKTIPAIVVDNFYR